MTPATKIHLTKDELDFITGHETPGWQARWLDQHCWNYTRAANGQVVVSRAHAESKLSGTFRPTLNIAAISKRS